MRTVSCSGSMLSCNTPILKGTLIASIFSLGVLLILLDVS
jgi:hypothetical protein